MVSRKAVRRSMLGLIEALEQQGNNASIPLDWRAFEDHIQYVYETLLRLDGHAVMVAKDACLVGRKGAEYQIDVYYEFEVAGIRHRVAIECKNTRRPVERKDVLAFKATIDDCLDVRGVIVSATGFQSGAKQCADDNGIAALGMDQLPSIERLLGLQLRHNAVPTENSVGTPFWTLFDIETGAPFGSEQDHGLYALLFWSKTQAARYRAHNRLGPNWEVRGLEQRHLFSYILVVDSMDGNFAVSPPPNHELAQDSRMFSEMPRQILIDEYCEEYRDQLQVRQVMPGVVNGRRVK